MPIIACVAAGAAAILRLFGPECMGGMGDFGAKIDAEIARTGLSDEEIGLKVNISVSYSYSEKADLISKDILPFRRKPGSNSWSSCNVRLRILPAEGMTYLN